MSFDTADLAIIETSLDVIPEPQRDIIARLIEMVREGQTRVDEVVADEAKALEKYRSGFNDAYVSAQKLNRELDDALREAKRLAQDVEDELARLDE